MRRLRGWLVRAAGMFRTGRREREMADEIESHLQLHTDENIRRGLSPQAARRAAVLTLGGVESLKEQYREQQGLPSLEHIAQDVKYAARTLRRTPGLTAIAVLTLAIGIAGPTAMFSMIKFWILEPLLRAPDTLVDLRYIDTSTGNYSGINPADFLDWSRSTRTLEELAAYRIDDYRLTGGDRPERAQGASVTPNFFRLIGARAALGRLFDDEDRKADKTPVTVLSHGLWRERFGADASILGRSVELDGRAHVVVGVLPESFQFTLLGRAISGRRWSSRRRTPRTGVRGRSSGSAVCATASPSTWHERSLPVSPDAWPRPTPIPTPRAACACCGWPTKYACTTTWLPVSGVVAMTGSSC